MSSTTADSVETLTAGRILPRVNLLPPEVHQARARRKIQSGLVAGVAGVAVIMGGIYALEVHATHTAQTALTQVTAQTAGLQAQKAKYSDVPKTIAAIDAAEDARQTAMAQDVEWYRYLNDLSYITPANVQLTNISMTLSNGSSSSATSAISTPGIASITFTGNASHHTDVATWLDSIAKEKGWDDAYFTNSTRAQDSNSGVPDEVTFSSTVNVTAAALSHRFDRKDG